MSLAILVKVFLAGVIGQLQSWDPKDRMQQILWRKKLCRREIQRKKTKRKPKADFWCASIPLKELFFTLWNTFMCQQATFLSWVSSCPCYFYQASVLGDLLSGVLADGSEAVSSVKHAYCNPSDPIFKVPSWTHLASF